MNKIVKKLSLSFGVFTKKSLAFILMTGAFSIIFAQSIWILHPVNGITSCLYCVSDGGGGVYCYAGGDSGIISLSTYYNTWTKSISGTTNDILGISGNVAVGKAGTIVTHGSGSSWNSQIAITKRNLRGLFGNGICVGDSGLILTSPNDSIWTPRTSGTLNCLRGIVGNGKSAIAVGDSGTILSSPDGIIWSKQVSGTKRNLNAVCFGLCLVAVGDSGTILTSSDGITWKTQISTTTNNLRGISAGIDAIEFQRALYVAVGDKGTILSSMTGSGSPGVPAGVTWTSQVSGTSRNLYGVTSAILVGRDSLLVVGDSGTILTSYYPPLATGIKQGGLSANNHNLVSITNNFVNYSLSELSQTSISLYDTKGRLVKILIDKIQLPGSYSVVIPHDVSPGVYTAVLKMGNDRINKAIVVSNSSHR